MFQQERMIINISILLMYDKGDLIQSIKGNRKTENKQSILGYNGYAFY